MSTQDKTRQALARHDGIRTAAFGEGGPPQPPPPPGKGDIGKPTKREIPANHPFDPKAIKPLVKMLWASSVALGHALTAHRQFSRLKSVGFSPDGMVGGRGYVMPVKDIRQKLHEASEALSVICDTIHDEVNAPHWKPKLADLEKKDLNEVERLMGDAEDYIEDPEGEAEEDMDDAERKGKKWSPDAKSEEDLSKGSKMPGGGNAQQEGPGPNPASAHRPALSKQSSMSPAARVVRRFLANSSVSPNTLPGPRVDHLGPAEGLGPFGSANREEPPTDDLGDAWGRDQGVGKGYSGNVSDHAGTSSVPDSNTDSTPTEGFDFGIGSGAGNDAHGQGAGGYGTDNPSSGGRGVYGPRADLPNDPGGKTHDDVSDSNPSIEQSTSGRSIPTASTGAGKLPNDDLPPVARSDYYQGDKGNDFNVTNRLSEAELPGDGGASGYDSLRNPGPNIGYRYERPDVPYTKFDYNTHQMRPDDLTQRDPIQGPYTK